MMFILILYSGVLKNNAKYIPDFKVLCVLRLLTVMLGYNDWDCKGDNTKKGVKLMTGIEVQDMTKRKHKKSPSRIGKGFFL